MKKLILILILLVPNLTEAAILKLATEGEIEVGGQIKVDLVLDTQNEQVNTVSGKVVLPDILELKEIKDGNSIINLWIDRPKVSSNNEIPFSGIIPGGTNKKDGFIFSLILESKKVGKAEISIENALVLKNDGLGSKALVEIKDLNFTISPPSSSPSQVLQNLDKEPPETFEPEIAQSSNLFDGKYFVVFATQDKNSGINHYEVKEGFFGKFVIGESPYLLQNQKLNKRVYIKAVDNEGNERIEMIKSRYELLLYESIPYLGIIVLILFGTFYLWKKRFTNSRS